MKTALLIIKCRGGYLREKDGDYQVCPLDKASVYPLRALAAARDHLRRSTALGMGPACLKKLVITEENFHEDDSDRAETPGS